MKDHPSDPSDPTPSKVAYLYYPADEHAQEAKEATIDLEDDNEGAVVAMLHYLYHADYDSNSIEDVATSSVLLHVRIYMPADKYFIPELRKKALCKLSDAVQTAWKTDGFTDAVAEIYATTPGDTGGEKHELRKVVLGVAVEHTSELFGTGKEHFRFKEMAWSTPELAADVTRAVACAAASRASAAVVKAAPIQRTPTGIYHCPHCNAPFRAAIPSNSWYAHSSPRWNMYEHNHHADNAMSGSEWSQHRM
ncbi:hypothetical protein LTR85_010625 [Meristemomyces frigidus]|nr:hypothetical protein LTR85_010625 [Meristemomyces frigidus]